ncbi:MAG: hypothetical protein QXQ14_00755 [Candidatus Aenigmatarchaeota archaeon]
MIEFDKEVIRIINFVENLTNANIKDCIIKNNTIYLLVDKKTKFSLYNIAMLKILKRLLNKEIKVYEYSSDLNEFLRNLIPYMISYRILNNNGKKIIEIKVNKMYKGLVLGRNKRNLEVYKSLLSRNFKINDVKII